MLAFRFIEMLPWSVCSIPRYFWCLFPPKSLVRSIAQLMTSSVVFFWPPFWYFSFSTRLLFCLEKHVHILPISQESPQGCVWNSVTVGPVKHWKQLSKCGTFLFHFSSCLSYRQPVLWKVWSVLARKVPQVSQHLCCASLSACPLPLTLGWLG